MIEYAGKYTNAKVMIDNIDESCASQIVSFINHPVFTNPVAIMPDCHAGKSSCIGFTMKMTNRIIPNVIGTDIGCGISSYRLSKEPSLPLEKIDSLIRENVPFGFSTHSKPVVNMERDWDWDAINRQIRYAMHEIWPADSSERCCYKWFKEIVKLVEADPVRVSNSLASLGSGNHFLELGIDNEKNFWLTIHTGSRNLGKCVCDYWQKKAVKYVRGEKSENFRIAVENLKNVCQKADIASEIFKLKQTYAVDNVSDELCYLEGSDARTYLEHMFLSQIYASENRKEIGKLVLKAIGAESVDFVESIHNYIDPNDLMIRKGAIRSYVGERCLIPFNMRDGILLCTGKSNAEWNFSAPHGAGRVLSRGEAKRKLDLNKFKEQMLGICSSSVNQSTLDEAPDAYKDAKLIEMAIGPTADIIGRIKPVLNLKDSCGKGE